MAKINLYTGMLLELENGDKYVVVRNYYGRDKLMLSGKEDVLYDSIEIGEQVKAVYQIEASAYIKFKTLKDFLVSNKYISQIWTK